MRSVTVHTLRNQTPRSRLRKVSASSTFETGASTVYSTGRTRSASGGGAPLATSTSGGTCVSAESMTSRMSPSAIGWRRRRFTRTILGMRVPDATSLRLLLGTMVSCILGCRQAPRARPRPPDAGTTVTVYVPPKSAERLAGRLQVIAAQHQWALSVRTDAAARQEADLAFVDSGGTLVGRVRAGSPAAAQARQMAEAVVP